MLSLMREKKGGEKYLSIWWFFVLVVIAGGIVSGVLIHAAAAADVRELESDILITKVADCLVQNGEVDSRLFEENFDIFKECKLSEKVINLKEDGKHFLKIEVYNYADCKAVNKVLECENSLVKDKYKYGVPDFENQCKLGEGRNFPVCSEKNFYVNEEDRGLVLHIFASSHQHGLKGVGL